MCLHIYTDKSEVPKNMAILDENDVMFDTRTLLNGNDTEKFILNYVDNASYISEKYVRNKFSEKYPTTELSTGCKTLLNVLNNPDKCYDVVECGNNALEALFTIRNGNVLWEMPIVCFSLEDESCDIIFRGKNYTNVFDFLGAVDAFFKEKGLL